MRCTHSGQQQGGFFMQTKRRNKEQTEKLALMALLTAIVAVLAYFGGFIKIGGLASISLTLIPVVLGAAMCGPLCGAWLGAVSGIVFFATADAIRDELLAKGITLLDTREGTKFSIEK